MNRVLEVIDYERFHSWTHGGWIHLHCALPKVLLSVSFIHLSLSVYHKVYRIVDVCVD